MSQKESQEKNRLIYWLKKRKRLLIGIITIIIIVLMIIFIDFSKLISNIINIGIWGILLFIITYTIAFLFRSYKLKVVFAGLNQSVEFSISYFSTGTAFIINEVTPGKLGDIAKILVIKDQKNLKLGVSVAGVTIERILDLLFLFIISSFTLIFVYFVNINQGKDISILGHDIQFYLLIGAIILTSILLFLIFLFYKQHFIIRIIQKISTKLATFLNRFLNNFKGSIKQFKEHKKEFFLVILLSFPTWIIDALILFIFFTFSGYNLNVIILILASILLFFSKTFPITPGGWVISENIGALFVIIFYPEIPYTDILSIFIIDHLFRSTYLFFYGGYSILHYNFKLKRINLPLDEIS